MLSTILKYDSTLLVISRLQHLLALRSYDPRSTRFNFSFIYDFLVFFRSENVITGSYDESLEMLTFNYTNSYNGMIYPFTRMIIYGVIWYLNYVVQMALRFFCQGSQCVNDTL
jgi:hypothetical protein